MVRTNVEGESAGAVGTQAQTEAATAADGGASIAESTRTTAPQGTSTGGMESNDAITTTAETAASGADAVLSSIPPGALFFAGGLLVLLLVVGYVYWQGRSR
jgi:hypothetical protein